MSAVVLSIGTAFNRAMGAEELTVRIEHAPIHIDKGYVAWELGLTAANMPAWNIPQAALLYGRTVRDALSAHPGVATVLQYLASTPVGTTLPLYLVLSPEPEPISWETLCIADDQFIALDRRWPLGRIVQSTTSSSRPPPRLTVPVRLLAVISALGIDHQVAEWEALRDAVIQARKNGLPITLKVLTGHPEVMRRIQEDEKAGLLDVEAGGIDALPQNLAAEVINWEPNLLHFFCHGRSDADAQYIELATALDYLDPARTSGSVRLLPRQLIDIGRELPNPWVLTLNCCDSGRGAKNLQSMASQIVSKGGFPAAVAMLEAVDARDAFVFSQAFYRSLLRSLRAAAKALKTEASISLELGEAMVDARMLLRDQHRGDAQGSTAWVFPVLYVHRLDALKLQRPPPTFLEDQAREFRRRAGAVAGWLKAVGARQSEDYRREVMEKVLGGDVPLGFWPDLNGEFPAPSSESPVENYLLVRAPDEDVLPDSSSLFDGQLPRE